MDGTTLIRPRAADLAQRGRLQLGDVVIEPSTRDVGGPGGQTSVEPRVMQVLLVLADAAGAVVTRDELLRRCWSSRFVGDDALNRAIAELRRVLRAVAADSLTVETIPRTGYRLAGSALAAASPAALDPAPAAPRMSRRAMVTGAVVLGAAGIAAAGWALTRGRDDARLRTLVAQAALATDMDTPEGYQRAVALLADAVALRPGEAELWGKLSAAWRAVSEYASAGRMAPAVDACEAAAVRALAMDPKQADARTALALLRPSYGDWLTVERRLLPVVADAPDHVEARDALGVIYQGVGRVREAAVLSEDPSIREALTPLRQYRRMYRIWSVGRLDEAERVIERATQLWPRHPGVWFARLYLTAFTGRAGVALAQVDDLDGRPAALTDGSAASLRLWVDAIRTGRPATVEAAVRSNLAEAAKGPAGAVTAIMALNALGRLDEAFAVSEGYLLRRGGPIMPLVRARSQPVVGDQHQRKTMMLFVPVSAPMRADPRFLELCRGCGLADYWKQSGHGPDFLEDRT